MNIVGPEQICFFRCRIEKKARECQHVSLGYIIYLSTDRNYDGKFSKIYTKAY